MMAKKTITVLAVMCIFSLFCGICCFAADDNSINLGNTVSETMDKAGRSIENVKNDIFSGNRDNDGHNNNEKDMINNGVNHVENGVNHIDNGAKDVGNAVVNTTRLDGYRTNNYNAVRTETTTGLPNTEVGGMTTTTWMWIILAVSAVIIIAAIWYYATQNNGRD